MRLWSVDLLKFLPDLQFRGQLREMMLILHQWRDEGHTNHLLINKVMEYDKKHLTSYFLRYNEEYRRRYGKEIDKKIYCEFLNFADYEVEKDYKISLVNGVDIVSIRLVKNIFDGWHTKEYLRSNMANLWEKHTMGVGKSRITDEEWQRLLDGYKEITGDEYVI